MEGGSAVVPLNDPLYQWMECVNSGAATSPLDKGGQPAALKIVPSQDICLGMKGAERVCGCPEADQSCRIIARGLCQASGKFHLWPDLMST
jgi:hypothetical protein